MSSAPLKLAISLLKAGRLMSLATNRQDGWPQNTVVGYLSEGLRLYFFVARTGQKYENLMRDGRVSAAIFSDFKDPSKIHGLSLGGMAAPVQSLDEYQRLAKKFMQHFPEFGELLPPNPAVAPIFELTPKVISVIDYSKGFGHSDLLTIGAAELNEAANVAP